MKLSVVIPVYKNHKLFLKSLKHNLNFFKNYEVVIVDDDPESDLQEKILGLNVIYLKNKKNLGFAGACNRGIEFSSGKYILLLNSDVFFKKGNIEEILKEFEKDRKIFAISFLQIDGGKRIGRNFLYWHKGFFEHKAVYNFESGINSWAEGGASIFDRKKFLNIGGFLTIYSPFYWEDIDLSYRAWKYGFKILFSPKLVFEHKHESSIGKYFKRKQISKIAYRNSFFFLWINISDLKLWFSYLLFFPIRFLKFLRTDKNFILGFISALISVFNVIRLRFKVQKQVVLSDREILIYFKEKIPTNMR